MPRAPRLTGRSSLHSRSWCQTDELDAALQHQPHLARIAECEVAASYQKTGCSTTLFPKPATRTLPGLSDGPIGQLEYPSANPFEIDHVLNAMDRAAEQSVFGWLIPPEQAGERVPCVVCCHGSLGWCGHHHEHMVRWLELGIAGWSPAARSAEAGGRGRK